MQEMMSLGVEQELFLLGADYKLISLVEHQSMLDSLCSNDNFNECCIDTEFFPGQIELRAGGEACYSISELSNEIRRNFANLKFAADSAGCRLLMTGTHPTQDWIDLKPLEKSEKDFDRFQFAARRFLINGLHLHIGVKEGQKLMLARYIRLFEPLFSCVTASSPFWRGVDTRMASSRMLVFQGLPLSQSVPSLTNWKSFETLREVRQLGCSHTSDGLEKSPFFWTIRPHHKYNTVEIRTMDAHPDIDRTISLVAFIQCLSRWILDTEITPKALLPKRLAECEVENHHAFLRVLCEENLWRAQRDGLNGPGEMLNLFELDSNEKQETIDAPTAIRKLLPQLEKYAAASVNGSDCRGELYAIEKFLDTTSSKRQRENKKKTEVTSHADDSYSSKFAGVIDGEIKKLEEALTS